MLSQFLSQIPAGDVRAFLCTEVDEVIASLEVAELANLDQGKGMIQTWDVLPNHKVLLEELLQALAQAALRLWPFWYGQAVTAPFLDNSLLEDDLLNHFKLQELPTTRQNASIPWLKAAVKACQMNQLPIFPNFPRTVQVAQLALAIDPFSLVILLAMGDRHPQPHKLLSFAQAATWLAQSTGASIAVLIPKELSNCSELDSVRYGAISLSSQGSNLAATDFSRPNLGTVEPILNPETAHSETVNPETVKPGSLEPVTVNPVTLNSKTLNSETVNPETLEESRHLLWPIQGRPHPCSPGEQLLAQSLSRDGELAELFGFNQRVQTCCGRWYWVDLLWSDGKVVVEIDGYRHHSLLFAFTEDRHRDYELLISGYLVLRLPHQEVVNDVEIALNKIREVVKFRRSQPFRT
ncbi:MAG: endonuclease domain-containing protein [Microcoleaceae cyanobacterium]